MSTLDIEIGELRPSPNNARTHSRKQIRQIANSIERFGFNNPVLVDDNNCIIAGHGRFEAAKLLNMTTVPVVRLSHLSDTEKRAYILADNKLAEKAGWDREILAIELQGLIDLDFDIELTGFEAAEVDLILDDVREASETGLEDQVPAYGEGASVTHPEDMWLCGTHRLLCADARDQTAYGILLEGEKAPFVFTDPPFNVVIQNNVSGNGRIRHGEFTMASGEMTESQFINFLRESFARLVTNTIDGSIHMICMDWRHQYEMTMAGRAIYSELKNLCVWNKTNAGMGSLYRSKHEFIYVWKSGVAAHRNNVELGQHGRNRTNVWDYAGVTSQRAGRLEELSMHPTVKPVALVADAIKDVTAPKDLVLDPFCGSGTILIAAERTGRQARALEIDPRYVDVAVRRWQKYAGKNAIHAASGETFEQREERELTATMSA